MEKNHIGLAIKRLAERKRLSVEDIANVLQNDRQSVYATYKRANVSPKAIEKYANAIGVSVEDVMKEAGYSNTNVLQSVVQNDSLNNGGDSYLMRYISQLEETVQILKNQLTEKDGQIRFLLGKSGSVLSARLALFFLCFVSKFGYTCIS